MTVLLSAFFLTAVLGFFNLAAFGTFGVLPIEGVFCATILVVVYRAIWRGNSLRIPNRMFLKLILAVWGAAALSSAVVIFQGDRTLVIQALKTFSHLTFLVGCSLLLLLLPIEAKHWRNALRFHFLISFVVMLFGLYQLPARLLELPLGWVGFSNVNFMRGIEEAEEMTQLALMYGNFYRATSIFSEPSGLASFGGTSLIMLIVPLFSGRPPILHSRKFMWTSIVVTAIAVFLTFSLTGVMIVASSAALLVILYKRKAVQGIAITLVTGVALIGAVDYAVYLSTDTSVVALFAQRITSIASGRAAENELDAVEGESITQRLADYEASWEIWKESPVVGVGPGNFANSEYGRYHSAQFPATTYGSSLAELGMIGFFTVSVFLVTLFVGTQLEEQKWVKSGLHQYTDEDSLASILPFKALVLIFVALTGNFLVTGVFWFDVVLLVSCRSTLRRAMGTETMGEFQIVSTSWRDRLYTAWGSKDIHDAYHRRESDSTRHTG